MRVNKHEADSYQIIRNRISNCKQMMSLVPEGLAQEDIDRFVASVIQAMSEAQWLERDWWGEIKAKYSLGASPVYDPVSGDVTG